MDPQLTVIICSWKRRRNVDLMIRAMREQTIDVNLWVWDNDGVASQSMDVDWHIRSSLNVHGAGIMMLFSMLKTPYWAYFDDDYCPRDNTLFSDILEVVKKRPIDSLVGAHGFNAKPDATYRQSQSADTEEPAKSIDVDMVKFRSVFGHSAGVRGLPFPWPTYHTDMHVSMHMAGSKRHHHHVSGLFRGRMRNLPEGAEAYSNRGNHYATRDRLMKEWLYAAGP